MYKLYCTVTIAILGWITDTELKKKIRVHTMFALKNVYVLPGSAQTSRFHVNYSAVPVNVYFSLLLSSGVLQIKTVVMF
jgi:hypothetical protein